jgi:hypothetical protein
MTSEIVNRLRKNSECLAPSIMLEAAEVIERLIAERDAARRQFCTATVSRPFGSGTIYNCGAAEEEATRRGWDCFKQGDGK